MVPFIIISAATTLGVTAVPANARTASVPATSIPGQSSTTPVASVPAKDDTGFGDIVVTAQRRSESVQKVPLSITTLTGGQLAAAGVVSTQDLQQVTPGLVWGRSSAFSQPTIRGIGSRNASPGDEPNVATYVDGVYQPEQFSTLFELADIERIEVLKGPQGTLFGRNATGGAISIVTKAPSFQPTGSLSVSYGRFDYRKVTGFVSGPIVDDLVAVSVSGLYSEDSGYIHNIFLDTMQGRSANYAGRVKILVTPSDRLKFQLNGSYLKTEQNATYSGHPLAGNTLARASVNPTGIPANILIPTGYYETATNFDPSDRVRKGSIDLHIDYEFDPFTVSALVFGGRSRVQVHSDVDVSPLNLSISDFIQHNNSYGEELLVTSNGDSGLRYVVGVTGYQGRNIYQNTAASRFLAHQTDHAFSAFGELTVEPLSSLFLTGGLRYTSEKRNADYQLQDAAFNPVGAQNSNGHTWTNLSPRAVFRWQFDPHANIYGSYSRGFKSGVFNDSTPAGIATPARPEKIEAFEVGVKGDVAAQLRFNIAAFHYRYTDLQTTVIVANGNTVTSLLQNAPEAKVDGIDASLDWHPTHRLSFNMGLSLLHAKVTDFTNASVTVPKQLGVPATSCVITGTVLNTGNNAAGCVVSGNYLLRAPDWTLNVGGTYSAPVGSGHVDFTASAFFSGRYYTDLINRLGQPAYKVVNGSITWRLPGDHLRVGVFGQNLTNQPYILGIFTSTLTDNVQYNKPRWFGVTAGYNF